MKKFSELLENTKVGALYGDGSAAIAGLTYDSRAVKPGDCFFAVPGTQSDGHDYIPSAAVSGIRSQTTAAAPFATADGM